ncbi:MAG: HlyD family efflux transporter periplasmic adaptor subunit [Pirellulaceae bacterium]|nr:HlyD family efflux transporter periplasmic adaptor subunit [Pirellulaceae bacterium]
MQALRSTRECTEFVLTLQSRPPRTVHAIALLTTLLVAAAVAWTWLTRVDLVVRAPGNVRPQAAPIDVFNPISTATSVSGGGRRIVALHCLEGDHVRRGQTLLQLDSRRQENDLAILRRTIRATEDELARTAELARLRDQRHEAQRAQLEARLEQARRQLASEQARREAELRAAAHAWQSASQNLAQLQQLHAAQAASSSELREAGELLEEARARHDTARLPVDDQQLAVVVREIEALEKAYQCDCGELSLQRLSRQADLDARRLELANLELELRQAVITAPGDGVVTSCPIAAGDLVEPGQKLLTIAPGDGLRFDVQLPGQDVAELRVGRIARVKLDALDPRELGTVPGKVAYVSPDSSPAESATANGSRHYNVQIALDRYELSRGTRQAKLKLGMSGQAEIIIGSERLLILFFKRVRHAISLG